MMDDARRTEFVDAEREAVLDELLARWHSRDSGVPSNGTDRLADPTFDRYQSYRGWDDEYELNDRELWSDRVQAVDFAVSGSRGQGGMDEPYRSAMYELAKNLCLGYFVWRHPRLPEDPLERGEVILEGKRILTRLLLKAGVLK